MHMLTIAFCEWIDLCAKKLVSQNRETLVILYIFELDLYRHRCTNKHLEAIRAF